MSPSHVQTLLQTPKFVVQHWTFEHPSIGPIERDIVVHPGAVLILPLLSEHEIVMIHNYRHAIGQELFELPAGTLETGEKPMDCAERELEEETGYRAKKIEALCEFFTSPGICTELMHAFVAHDLIKTRQKLDETEQIRTEIIGLECALQMVATGRIRDGKTIAALGTYYLQCKD